MRTSPPTSSLILIGFCSYPLLAFSSVHRRIITPTDFHSRSSLLPLPLIGRTSLLSIRGGSAGEDVSDGTVKSKGKKEKVEEQVVPSFTIMTTIQSLAMAYASVLSKRPLLTKSITSGVMFGLSDFSAQSIKQPSSTSSSTINKKDWNRTITSALVGLLYFGPAAHYWYEAMFRFFPQSSPLTLFQKTALGQIIFGPVFTCLFFGISLYQSKTFTISNWLRKIKMDLPSTWLAGLGYWSLVDAISYSVVKVMWIPLFVNFCSFVWTIYLSLVANRKKQS